MGLYVCVDVDTMVFRLLVDAAHQIQFTLIYINMMMELFDYEIY